MIRLVGRDLQKDDEKVLLCKDLQLKALHHDGMSHVGTMTTAEAIPTGKVVAKVIAHLDRNKILH